LDNRSNDCRRIAQGKRSRPRSQPRYTSTKFGTPNIAQQLIVPRLDLRLIRLLAGANSRK
jgi:hypothetical protein